MINKFYLNEENEEKWEPIEGAKKGLDTITGPVTGAIGLGGAVYGGTKLAQAITELFPSFITNILKYVPQFVLLPLALLNGYTTISSLIKIFTGTSPKAQTSIYNAFKAQLLTDQRIDAKFINNPTLMGVLDYFIYKLDNNNQISIIRSTSNLSNISAQDYQEYLKTIKTDIILNKMDTKNTQTVAQTIAESTFRTSLYDLMTDTNIQITNKAWTYGFAFTKSYGIIGFYYPSTRLGLNIVLDPMSINRFTQGLSIKEFIKALICSQRLSRLQTSNHGIFKGIIDYYKDKRFFSDNLGKFSTVFRELLNLCMGQDSNDFYFDILKFIDPDNNTYENYKNFIKNKMLLNKTGEGIFFYGLAGDNKLYNTSRFNPDNPSNLIVNINKLPDDNLILLGYSNNSNIGGFIVRPGENIHKLIHTKNMEFFFKIPTITSLNINVPLTNNLSTMNFISQKLPLYATLGAGAATILSSSMYKQWAEEFCNLHPVVGSIIKPILQNPKTSATIIGTLIAMGYSGLARKLLNFFKSKESTTK